MHTSLSAVKSSGMISAKFVYGQICIWTSISPYLLQWQYTYKHHFIL